MFKDFSLRSLSKAIFQFFGLTAGKAVGFDDNGQMKSLDGVGASVSEDELALVDNTTANASITKHGLLKKLSNVATEVLDGQGNWRTIAAILGFTPANAASLGTASTHAATDFDTAGAAAAAQSAAIATAASDATTKANAAQTAAIAAIPAKATGADVDAGTDDVKYVTAKAIADSTTLNTPEGSGVAKTILGVTGGSLAVVQSGLTVFTAPFDPNLGVVPVTIEREVEFVVPYAGTLKNLFYRTGNTSGGATVAAVVRKNEADTALTVTGAATTHTTSSDTTHTVAVAQGDRVTISLTTVDDTSVSIASISIEYDAT